jgi:hypothetical protein
MFKVALILSIFHAGSAWEDHIEYSRMSSNPIELEHMMQNCIKQGAGLEKLLYDNGQQATFVCKLEAR